MRLYGPPLIEYLGVQFMCLGFVHPNEAGIGPVRGQRRVSGAGSSSVFSALAAPGMNAEASMAPLAQLFRFLGGEFALLCEKLEDACAKQFGDLFSILSTHRVEGMRA